MNIGELAVRIAHDLAADRAKVIRCLQNAVDRDGLPTVLSASKRKRSIRDDSRWLAFAACSLRGTMKRPVKLLLSGPARRDGEEVVVALPRAEVRVKVPDFYMPPKFEEPNA